MSFDGTVMRAVVTELNQTLLSGRITKIYQPFKTELLFTVRANGANHQLLLSANPSFARMHLTNEKVDNPAEPPMFCMLLRKHLEGGIIEGIEQLELERIVKINIKGRNELGDVSYKKLMVEIMGRHSNIVLLDEKGDKILDSIKHLSPGVNSYRTILPGQTYKLPPEQEKLNPLSIDKETFIKKMDFNSGKLDSQMLQQFSGLSPQLTKEILYKAKLPNRETLTNAFLEVIDEINLGHFKPQITTTTNKEHFSIIELSHLNGTSRMFDSVSEMLNHFYFGKAERDRVHQQANDLEKFLKNEFQKNKSKIKKLEQTLVDAEAASKYRKLGELLTAYLHQIKKGQKEVEVIDFYDEEGKMVSIPLDPLKSPSDNAQSYFKRYNKAKNSLEIVKAQIEIAQQELIYLESILGQMESAAPRDIAEIREELIEGGYIRNRNKKQVKKKKETKPFLEEYKSSTGVEILVGKNNKQNEYLTNRLARQSETWLHTKDIPGSHVVIRSSNIDETTLVEAAQLAAYFSKAKHSSSVPVDYTLIKHVKKPSGSKPGYVIYDNQTTVYVTPAEDVVKKLRK
ncbi:fibronectin/fibrinogen-binding protein [Anaerobacillus alkaliphilus]|uniref:Rqc2 homolog RqcH n=1 Tax=Anaerobacillus alkaliphilus TaxID=1548597 RepID=A0A4Q0VPC0_9BACI|nr:NFACT RNA binding domain-containing protein [Anaerobacillus alkaliphilus]RXI98068.1 fibronectin/fibrinogen-binding protein [Anaerobacillus alkaliphilus]